MSITFWQNIPSMHQAPLIRALAERWHGSVRVVVEDTLVEERGGQGWRNPDRSPGDLIVSPTGHERRAMIQSSSSADDIHIFSGFHAYQDTYLTLKEVANKPVGLGIFAEPGRTHDGILAWLRRIRCVWHSLRWGRRIDFLLTTGRLGEQWYIDCGFEEKKVVPFGYFVEPNLVSEPGATVVNPQAVESYRFLFVGQLIHRKGIDLLLRALSRLSATEWFLDVIGNGPQEEQLRRTANEVHLSNRIRWLGSRPNEEVRLHMRQADCLALPSRFDGWGAVVNEALHAGTPVITTDACGASELIRSELLGTVVPSNNVSALVGALEARLERGAPSAHQRCQICSWAHEHIHPEIGATYLIDVLKARTSSEEVPSPPWRYA